MHLKAQTNTQGMQKMSDHPASHLCLTCKLAQWKKTTNGRLHPGGDGKCRWKPPHIPTPESWHWGGWSVAARQPTPLGGGYIMRRPEKPITECETYEGENG